MSNEETRADIERRVREVIVDQLGVDPKKINLDSNIVNDLGADSLDEVELVMSCEEEFQFQIPDEDTEKLKTVKDVIDYIETHLNNA